MNNGTDNSLSSVLVRHLFLLAGLTLGFHAPLTLFFQIAHLPFRYYLMASPLLALCSLVIAGASLRRRWKTIGQWDWEVVVSLLLLGVVCTGIAFVTHTPAEDDYYYVANAVHFLHNPGQGMDFQWHYFRGAEEQNIVSYNQGTSMAFDYFRAAAASWLRLDYLDVYYTLTILVLGLFLPLGHYLLIGRFARTTPQALAGTAIAISLLLLLSQRILLHGSLVFGHLQMGKIVVLAIAVPVFAALSIDYLRKPAPSRWLALFLLVMTAVGMSASAALLLPLLSVCLLCASLLTRFLNGPNQQRWWAGGFSYLAGSAYAIGYLLFLFYQLRIRQGASDPFAIAYAQSGAPFRYQFFLQPLFITILAITLLGALLLTNGWRRWFLAVWTLAVTLLLLDPLTFSLIIDRLVPQNIYWRIFYLLPFPLLGAVTAMEFWHRIARGRVKPYGRLAVVVLLGLAMTHYCWDLKGRKELQLSRYKLDYRHHQAAREVARIAPDGVMLAPEELFFIIPMIDSGHPQVNVLFHDGKFVMRDDLWSIRTGAAHFAGNKSPYEEHFIQLVEQGILDVIVLRSRVLETSQWDIEAILREQNYLKWEIAGDYLVYWRERS